MERLDRTGFGELKIFQDTESFCYGIDAVILSYFASQGIKKENVVFDLGTGNGIIPLILSYKTKLSKVVGIDIQKNLIEMARKSVELNGLKDKIEFIEADVSMADRSRNICSCNMKEDSCDNLSGNDISGFLGQCDVVTCNPPYFPKGRAVLNSTDSLTLSRHETCAELRDFMDFASLLLKEKGRLYMINRPSRFADSMCFARDTGMEPRNIRIVSSTAFTKPKMILMEFIKGGGVECRFGEPLIIYNGDGTYTCEILKAYDRK